MKAFVLAAVLAAAAVPSAQAANARDPYGNVDPRWDRGNYTGNSETDRLNDMQLRAARGEGYAPPGYYRRAEPRYYPPPGYYRAPPAYYPPPGYYRPY